MATHPSDCDLDRFLTALSQVKKAYLYFHPEASECGGCEDLDGRIAAADIRTPIYKVPGDTCPQIADHLGIQQYPTVILVREGKVAKVHTGVPNEKIVERMVRGK